MSDLDTRAARAGILEAFRDLSGETRVTPPETKAALLAAMGLDGTAPPAHRELPPWQVCEPGVPPALTPGADWTLTQEDGTRSEGRGPLPALPLGRHRLQASGETCWLLCAPARLPLPERMWGLMVPLAGLRTAEQGGIGGYDDLAAMAEGAAAQGASFLGINPIHAGFPADPGGFSPYTPSHRRRFAGIYLPTATAAGAPGRIIDVAAETPARMEALEAEFRAAPPGPAFDAFLAHEGAALQRFATHQALSERLGAYWGDWPAAYRDPASPEVAQAAREMADRVRFHAWLQYRAEGSLAEAQGRATGAGMALGLYLDVAVGTHPQGAETWEDRETFAFGASLGAPPDAFAPQGQNWHLAPFNPVTLIETGFEALATTLRQQLRFAGALRIDHILGFERAYWVPDGDLPGAYVAMPREAMLAVTRMEAARAGAVIVGEDLGVIPEGLQQALADSGILGCRLACFEHREDPPVFKRPEDYDEGVIASFSTHDLPTWTGWREGREIALRRDIGLTPPEHAEGMFAWRGREVAGFDWASGKLRGDLPPEAPEAMVSFLAETRSRMVALQAEDMLGVADQPNLPGTVREYPNWRQRLPEGPSGIAAAPVLANAARIMKRAARDPRVTSP
ncbi:4-alpha-glucanotransferase [Salipiger mucosus]|uniref:4-alpha-glucanotransferase n=1 Tax=Salipiger mucosus DSM 16094 TaxID=1123237 RepID=S9Q7Z1_9RHOB|nr:4-alpha-glucanotransferase [Salipiger mucosus]EPX76097.1 4-alpha-glucanotransferase (amylomaltase) [Salipiger mucosus DSM 16094]